MYIHITSHIDTIQSIWRIWEDKREASNDRNLTWTIRMWLQNTSPGITAGFWKPRFLPPPKT